MGLKYNRLALMIRNTQVSFDTIKTEVQIKVQAVYEEVNKISYGAISIFVDSIQHFSNAHGAEAAASLAYYALFSIFPFLIFLAGSASSVLADESIQQFLIDFVQDSLPAYFQDLVKENIEQALALRGQVQILGTIGLLWAASAVFTVLTHNIDRAWKVPQERGFILGRLIGLSMIAALSTGLFVLWLLSTTLLNILPALEIPLWNGESIHLYDTYLWGVTSRLIPGFVIFFAFINLYRWVPRTRVQWKEAAWGAAIAALGWEIVQRGFGWYFTSGLARYQLVYGSLGAVIAFMLWLYVSALIVLYGAHLSAAIARKIRPDEAPE